MGHEFEQSIIKAKFSSEEEAERATGLSGWIDLVMAGYGFEGDADFARMQFETEYSFGRDPVIVAFNNDKLVIATLVLSRMEMPDLNAYGVHGVVVRPEYKGIHLGSKLYETAFREVQLDAVFGSTKNPFAVLSRASAGRKAGMRTFYGKYEVTSGEQSGECTDHLNLLYRNLARRQNVDWVTSVTLKPTDSLPPDIPDLTGMPDYIKLAFVPVIRAQKEIGDKMTATMPLITSRPEVLIGSSGQEK